jgi:hypothetical protein
LKNLEGVLDKWIVSGSLATVSSLVLDVTSETNYANSKAIQCISRYFL